MHVKNNNEGVGRGVADDVTENDTWIVETRRVVPPETIPLSDLIYLYQTPCSTHTRLDYPLRVRMRDRNRICCFYNIFRLK